MAQTNDIDFGRQLIHSPRNLLSNTQKDAGIWLYPADLKECRHIASILTIMRLLS